MSSRKMKRIVCKLIKINSFVVALLLYAFSMNAAEINGTVTDSEGQIITEANIYVFAGSGGKCDSYSAAIAATSSADGTYTLSLSTGGTYYLQAHVFEGKYFDEWWSTGSSDRDCNNAESITIGTDDTITGKDFQLDEGASISGTVFSSDTGLPVTGVSIQVYPIVDDADRCTSNPTTVQVLNYYVDQADGTYTLEPLPADTYYLRTIVTDDSLVDEWWDTPYSRFECSRGQDIFVEELDTITGKDFQLLDREPEVGNINMDSSVDLADAILALQGLTSQPSERIWLEGDTNLDDQIGMADILYLLLLLSGSNP